MPSTASSWICSDRHRLVLLEPVSASRRACAMLEKSAVIWSGLRRRSRKLQSTSFVLVDFGADGESSSLQTKAARMHPKEYSKARARYPSPEC